MNRLSFWHKFAFITNCCWLVTWIIRYRAILPSGEIQSTIVVTGLVLAYIVNTGVNLWTALLFLLGRLGATKAPRWLVLTNVLFLLLQLYFFCK